MFLPNVQTQTSRLSCRIDVCDLMFQCSISLLRKAPPSPPQNLHVTNVTSKSVTIEWETPDSNGGTEITSYIIEKLLTKSSQWSRVATLDSYCLSYCIDNLKETTELSFRVVAENAIGASAPAYTEPVTLKTHASTLNVVIFVSFVVLLDFLEQFNNFCFYQPFHPHHRDHSRSVSSVPAQTSSNGVFPSLTAELRCKATTSPFAISKRRCGSKLDVARRMCRSSA